jgi:hypothetical protein
MPKSCIVCSAVASPELQLQYCAACQSALYCSRACQRIDWKKQHKRICKLLNVGHGDMQVRQPIHAKRSIDGKELFEYNEDCLHEDDRRFFKLFAESTLEGSRAAARKMNKIAKRQTKFDQEFLLFHSLSVLVRFSKSEMLSWPNSPLLVMLQLVDPNIVTGTGDKELTTLHHLVDLADAFEYSTHENQLILAKQLIEHGANVNAVRTSFGSTPLHSKCYARNVTNLDFVELLLEKGADPNAQDHQGMTPLMYTIPFAPGAAKFMLNWPTTDANITTRSRACFLLRVRKTVTEISDNVALPDNPDRVQNQFLLQQWREIEEMLLERGAVNTGITLLGVQRASSRYWSSDVGNYSAHIRSLPRLETRSKN